MRERVCLEQRPDDEERGAGDPERDRPGRNARRRLRTRRPNRSCLALLGRLEHGEEPRHPGAPVQVADDECVPPR
jgi:hypothetical protein